MQPSVKITQKELKKCLYYNPATGIFTRKKYQGVPKEFIGKPTGRLSWHGYIRIKINQKTIYAHRLAWLYYYGYLPEGEIDHKNNNRTDNRIKNLREASRQCQSRNCGNHVTNTSSVKGVSWYKQGKKWQSQIKNNGKQYGLGHYNDFNNAVCARLAAEQCLDWANCDSSSPAYLYVKNNIQS